MPPAYNKSGSYAYMKPSAQEEELDEASVWDAQAEDSFAFHSKNKSDKGSAAPSERKTLRVGGKRSIEGNNSAGEHKIKQQISAHPSGISTLSSTLENKGDFQKPEGAFIPIKRSGVQQSSTLNDDDLPIKMGTSAPINIPSKLNNIHNSSPVEGKTQSFIPPHLMGRTIDENATVLEEDQSADMSRSVLKREQLRQRRSVLEQTGFLEPAC